MILGGSTAFVTGGTGFIGGRLIEVLTSQYDVKIRALVRNNHSGGGSYRLAGCGAEIIEGDIADETSMIESVQGCDYVFHCAFGTSGDPELDRHVTIDGTTSLARAAAVNGARHFVNLSTIVVFGDTPTTVNETFVPNRMWDWPYPHHKLAAERAVLAENARSKLPVTTLRLGSVYGPWGPAFTYYPISCLTSGKVVLVNGGNGNSNAVYIDDVIQAMILAARRGDVPPDMFIIRGPDNVTWRQFYDAYEKMLGTDSLVNMTLKEVESYNRRQQRVAVQRILPYALGALKRDSGFKDLARQLPLLKPAWKAYKQRFGAAAASRATSAAPAKSAASMDRPLYALPKMMWGYYASQTDYKIDHARQALGYEPGYDLAKGMALTGQWAGWAGLIIHQP